MREELIKLDRYQKQFRFLVANNIETGAELSALQKSKSDEIERLVIMRKQLYDERTDENCEKIKEKAKKINAKVSDLRCEVRLCKTIFKDSYRISKKNLQAQELWGQAEKEMRENEHKRRSR